MRCKLLLASVAAAVGILAGHAQAAEYDLFYAGGQSNAWPAWASAIRTRLASSGKYQNVEVINGYHPGAPLSNWYDLQNSTNKRQANYLADFSGGAAGSMTARMAQITAQGDTYRICGFFWFQGEADSGDIQRVNVYQATFQGMFENVKADLGVSSLPLVMTQVWGVPDLISQTQQNNIVQLRQIQQDIADSAPLGATIDSQSYTRSDAWHLTPAEQTRMGTDAANVLLATVPEPTSALGLLCGGMALLCGRHRRG